MEASTEFTRQETIQLQKFYLFSKNRILLITIAAVLFAAGITVFLMADSLFGRIAGAVAAAVFGLGFPFLCWAVILLSANLQYLKRGKRMPAQVQRYYKVDETNLFRRISSSDGFESTEQAPWNQVRKAYETKTHYILYVGRWQTFEIPKSGISDGTTGDMTEFLNRTLGKRFMAMRRNNGKDRTARPTRS